MAAAVAMLAGCQKNPDSSIVVNKDMDKLIDQANETGKGMENIADNYETYQTQISDTSLMVTVNVDASVDIPQVDKMSVFRVQQAPVTQEMLDKVIEVLIGNETLYNGGVVLETRTKADIEKEIGEWKSYLENLKRRMNSSERNIKARFPGFRKNMRMHLQRLSGKAMNRMESFIRQKS